jgi:low temperature requirement protein LtrA
MSSIFYMIFLEVLAPARSGRHTERMKRASHATAPTRVTTFELFFDLVFVLTITRLAEVLHHEPDIIGLLTVLVILANIWWMYSGYSWLTSNTGTSSLTSRLLLFVAMGGFLVMAIATPNAFGEDGLAFGLAYLVVTVVHLGMFGTVFEHGAVREMLQIAPYNLGSAALLIIAGFVDGAADWWLWGAAAALHVVLLEVGRYRSFSLPQAHFVERNGVVLIVALGESMVALGLGLGDHPLNPPVLLAALMSLALAAALWSLYFVDADAAAERTLQSAPRESVLRIAGLAFSYAFVPLLAGIVMISASLTEVLEHPLAPLTTANAAFLAGGASIYVLGIAAFRQAVAAVSGVLWLASVLAAAACIGGLWLGTAVAGIAEVAFVVVILFALVIVGHRPHSRVEDGSSRTAVPG